MARIQLQDVELMSNDQKKQYDRFPSNLTRALLITTESTSGYLSLGASFPAGAIADKDREMVILRVGMLSNSAYEKMQHMPLAIKAGWSEIEIERIEQGIGADARSSAILCFVDECVRNVKVSDGTFSALCAYFSNTQIAELTLLIGHYMMTARFLETLEVDLDGQATSWENI